MNVVKQAVGRVAQSRALQEGAAVRATHSAHSASQLEYGMGDINQFSNVFQLRSCFYSSQTRGGTLYQKLIFSYKAQCVYCGQNSF